MFEKLFGFSAKGGDKSIFAGEKIEVMKSNGRGTFGHIAVKTNYMNRAIRYLSSLGVEFDKESEKRDENGNLTFVYLKDEIGGFAVHLIEK